MNKRLRKKLDKHCSDMELGNIVFGNSRGIYKVNRDWQYKFNNVLDSMGFDSYGYYDNKAFFENEIFSVRPYYWGEDEDISDLPNFVYKPTNYILCWYKYPLRDSYANRHVSFEEFTDILNKCLISINNIR